MSDAATERRSDEGAERERIVVILGPTAGGKTELAIAIAQALDGEIVNADSMQVYRRLDVGTAKPTAAQRAAAPHHLVDIVEPTEPWTVADWLGAAEAAIADIQSRRKLAIVVGGTNLYLKALLEGMFEGPPADEAFRAQLAEVVVHELHERLTSVDPAAAERINPNDRKRITRALEVHHATGTPISDLQRQWQADLIAPYRHDPVLIGLHWPTEAINRRINARVKRMFGPTDGSEDLISETRRLDAAGLLGPQARQALGTKQALEHLAGKLSLDEALEKVKVETRRFGKAQRTWLKRYRGVHWLDATALLPNELLRQAAAIARSALASR